MFRDCGFQYFKDINGGKVLQAIEGLRKTIRTKDGLKDLGVASGNTKKYFLRACKQFCKWAVQDGRATTNPLEHLSRTGQVENPMRPFTVAEFQTLLDYTKTAPDNFCVSGTQRALIYRFGVE